MEESKPTRRVTETLLPTFLWVYLEKCYSPPYQSINGQQLKEIDEHLYCYVVEFIEHLALTLLLGSIVLWFENLHLKETLMS